MENKDIHIAKVIAQEVLKKGGRTFFVGGCVRDEILGIDIKDVDIEVHNIEVEDLVKILESIGDVQKIGSFFGVFNLKGYDIDIAMPRKEKSNGRGHKDFEIFVDPFIGYKEAALRRDFTINSLMKDVLSGEIIDSFNGIEDLNNKIIRHVNDESFCEDPLRVFRGAQFAARFDFEIHEKTKLLSSTMDVSSLAFERVFDELKKALLKANKPSIFFKSLKDMNQLSYWFKEVEDLIGINQSEIHHPEGDVFTHTMMVLDEAAKLRDKAKNKLAHMKPNQMYNSAKKKSMMKLWDDAIHPSDLILLAKADALGRGVKKDYSEIESMLNKSLNEYKELMLEPEVVGKDLIELGLKPGILFSEYIKLGHKLHLSGLSKDEILKHIKADINKKSLV